MDKYYMYVPTYKHTSHELVLLYQHSLVCFVEDNDAKSTHVPETDKWLGSCFLHVLSLLIAYPHLLAVSTCTNMYV